MLNRDAVLRGLNYLNDKHIARILVCVGPGLVVHKIAIAIEAPPATKMAATAFLGVGVLCYVGWKFIYSRVVGEDRPDDGQGTSASAREQELVLSPAIPGGVHVELVKELIVMCGDAPSVALSLIASEIAVSPDLTYPAAIELAHRRKAFEVKNRSGS
jgi:hypothetical protein